MAATPPPSDILGTPVRGSAIMQRVFYDSITGLTAADIARCPYGCTLRETQLGTYVVDHVRRVAYPLPTPAERADADSELTPVGTPSAPPTVTAAAVSNSGGGSTGGLSRAQVAVMKRMYETKMETSVGRITILEAQLASRKEEVQALQRKLTNLHKDLEHARRTARDALKGTAPAALAVAPATASAPLSVAVESVTARAAHGKRPRRDEESDRSKRTIRYGDSRIGVADETSSSSSESSSSSSLYSSSSSASSRSQSASRSSSHATPRSSPTPPHESPVHTPPVSYRSEATRRRSDTANTTAESTKTSAKADSYAAENTRKKHDSASETASPAPLPWHASMHSSGSAGENDDDRNSMNHPTVVNAVVRFAPCPSMHDDDAVVPAEEADTLGLRHDAPVKAVAFPNTGGVNMVKSAALLPAELVHQYRGAVLYCHLCSLFFAPHPVSLRQHILSSPHQKVCRAIDAYIEEKWDLPGAASTGNRDPTDLTRLQRLKAKKELGSVLCVSPTARTQFGKVMQNMPPFMVAQGVVSAEDQAAVRHSGNSFFDEGFDVVMSMCSYCNEPVTTQSYKVHESSARHRANVPKEG